MNLKRNLYILKCRVYVLTRHLIEKVLLQLSNWGWIYCHRVYLTRPRDESGIESAPDFSSDRFIFSVSYIRRVIEFKHEYWFETLKGKRIFTVDESYHLEGRLIYRAELKAFFAHFPPRQRMWIHREAPVVYIQSKPGSFYDESSDTVELKTHRCDFSQCRYAFEFSYAPEQYSQVKLSEVISESHRAFGNQLTNKIPEINKILTGADYDGEMMSPNNMPLSNNLLCKKCGLPVFASSKDKYQFECLRHGELNHSEVIRVDPVEYQQVLGYTSEILEDLIEKSCPRTLTFRLEE